MKYRRTRTPNPAVGRPALEESATLVRVGTAIFGTRTGKAWKPEAAGGFDD